MATYKGREVRQKITHLGDRRFRVSWQHQELEKSALLLDFQPLVNVFKLQPPYVLLHWQAKPHGLRRWGVYDGKSNQYYGIDYDRFQTKGATSFTLLQIDETRHNTKPTAVILFPNRTIGVTPHNQYVLE